VAATINPLTEKIIRAVKNRWAEIKGHYLRDHFARAALTGLLASGRVGLDVEEERIARMSYQQADAMLRARGNTSQ